MERQRPRPPRQRRLERHWTIPTSLSALWALIYYVERLIHPYAPSRQEREDALLALVEALSNAFNSSSGHPGSRVAVNLAVSPRYLKVSIKDQGGGVVQPQAPVPLAADTAESGRGLFLIEQVMDRVSWSPSGDAIVMTRRWRPVREHPRARSA